MEAVDPQIRINLYHYEPASLEKLVQHPDRFIARLKQGHRSQPTPYPGKESSANQSLINEVLESRLDLLQRSVSELSQSGNHSIVVSPKSRLMAPNATADLLIGIRLPNYLGVVNPGFAITTAALATALQNVKDPPAPEELLPLHLHICTTSSLPLPNLLTTVYFLSLTTFPRLAFRSMPAPPFPFFLRRGWVVIV